jgi:hypothetical protein
VFLNTHPLTQVVLTAPPHQRKRWVWQMLTASHERIIVGR